MTYDGQGIHLIIDRSKTYSEILYIKSISKAIGAGSFENSVSKALISSYSYLSTGVHTDYLKLGHLVIPEEFLKGLK